MSAEPTSLASDTESRAFVVAATIALYATRVDTRTTDTVGRVTDDHVLDVAGQSIPITSPDKVFFSERGETTVSYTHLTLPTKA